MPPKIANKPVKEKERFFVNLFVKASGDRSQIPALEKRAHLKAGSGVKILQRKAVQKDIAVRLAPVQAEQVRQESLGQTIEFAKQTYQAELAKQVEVIKCHKLEMSVLTGRLMQGVIGLNMHQWPKELLEYIKTAMVVEGAMQIGNTKRIIPAEESKENPAALVYSALFDQMRSGSPEPAKVSAAAPQADSDGVYDLYPSAPKPVIPDLTVIPPPGESIEETPAAKPSDPNVIVVEVG